MKKTFKLKNIEIDCKSIEKKIDKFLEKEVDPKALKKLKRHKGKINSLGFKLKMSSFIDPKNMEKEGGALIEIFETKSKHKILNGINIDIGATNKLNIMAGISKDFNFNKLEQLSIGGYISINEIGKSLYERLFNTSKDKTKVKVKLGISKAF